MSSGIEPRVTVDESKAGKELTEQMMWLVTGTHGYIRVKHADGTEEMYGPGDVDVAAEIPDDAQHVRERFEEKVIERGEGQCWGWDAYTRDDGYGHFWYDGNMRSAHRISYRLYVGPIPSHLQVNHQCGTAECTKIEHLYLGTQPENMDDAVDHGTRDRKLSDDDVREIRERYRTEDVSQYDLATEFGVDQPTIWAVINREMYDYVD